MSETARKNRIAALLAPMGLVLGMSSAPIHAANDGPFVTTPGGMGVTTRYGECWQAVHGTANTANCGTKEMMAVDGDSDGDGVADSMDQCPNTPKGARVDARGCPLDSDGDGVADYMDDCPGTPTGAKVNSRGCEIAGDIVINVTTDHFDFDSATLKPAMAAELDSVADKVRASRGDELLEIIGHTDATGPEGYNQGLSERRAQAAADYLAGKGISPSSMTVKGMGESSPVADNATREGRAMNRRVEILTR